MEQLPWDCVRLLVYKLPLGDMYRLGVTSKCMSKLFDDEVLWRALFYRDKHISTDWTRPPHVSWRNLHKCYYPLKVKAYPAAYNQAEECITNLAKCHNQALLDNIEYHCKQIREWGDASSRYQTIIDSTNKLITIHDVIITHVSGHLLECLIKLSCKEHLDSLKYHIRSELDAVVSDQRYWYLVDS